MDRASGPLLGTGALGMKIRLILTTGRGKSFVDQRLRRLSLSCLSVVILTGWLRSFSFCLRWRAPPSRRTAPGTAIPASSAGDTGQVCAAARRSAGLLLMTAPSAWAAAE